MRVALLVPLALLAAGCASDDPDIPGDQAREPPAPAGARLRLVDEGMVHGGTTMAVFAPGEPDAEAPVGCAAYRKGVARGDCRVEVAKNGSWLLHARWSSPQGDRGVFAFDAQGNATGWWLDECRAWRVPPTQAKPTWCD